MSEAHRQYELAYVVSPTVTDDGVNELHERISEIVGQLGGTVDNTDIWGRRRLAYEINRHREGTYVIVLISGPGGMVTELERRLRVMEQLLRHLVIRVDEVMRKAAHKRSRRQGKQERRRAAKGASAGVAAAAETKSAAEASPAAAAVAAEEPPSAAEEPPAAAEEPQAAAEEPSAAAEEPSAAAEESRAAADEPPSAASEAQPEAAAQPDEAPVKTADEEQQS